MIIHGEKLYALYAFDTPHKVKANSDLLGIFQDVPSIVTDMVLKHSSELGLDEHFKDRKELSSFLEVYQPNALNEYMELGLFVDYEINVDFTDDAVMWL